MSQTPRTDAEFLRCGLGKDKGEKNKTFVSIEFARTLEEENNKLKNTLRLIKNGLELSTIASCHCMVKTNDIMFHSERCPYRQITEIIEKIEKSTL